jgi:hypothetical protein
MIGWRSRHRTITIDVTPEQEARLTARAQAAGIGDPAKYLLRLIDSADSAQRDETDPTLALFEQWDREDADMTPAEVEKERTRSGNSSGPVSTQTENVSARSRAF